MTSPAITEDDHPQIRRQSGLLTFLSRFWATLFLLALILFFWAAAGRVFVSPFNVQSILANMTILTIIALGQTYAIISGGIDLSAGWVMGMASVIAALVVNALPQDMSIGLVVVIAGLAGLGAALIAGFVNGVLIARLNVPPFIATLGMFGIARGVAFILSGGLPVAVYRRELGSIGNGYVLYTHPEAGWSWFQRHVGLAQIELRNVNAWIPYVVIFAVILILLAHFLLSRMKFGLYTYAIGGNKEASLRAGIPVGRQLILIYMLSAGFAAMAAVVYLTRLTNGAANAGEALLLDTVAAVVIGGASLFGGAGTILGTVIGALIIAVLANGLVILRVDPFWQFIAVGVVIIIAVLIDQAREKLVRG